MSAPFTPSTRISQGDIDLGYNFDAFEFEFELPPVSAYLIDNTGALIAIQRPVSGMSYHSLSIMLTLIFQSPASQASLFAHESRLRHVAFLMSNRLTFSILVCIIILLYYELHLTLYFRPTRSTF
jgi:hypothetical protein